MHGVSRIKGSYSRALRLFFGGNGLDVEKELN